MMADVFEKNLKNDGLLYWKFLTLSIGIIV